MAAVVSFPGISTDYLSTDALHNISTDYLHNMYLRFYYKAVKARSCSLKSRCAGSNLWPGWRAALGRICNCEVQQQAPGAGRTSGPGFIQCSENKVYGEYLCSILRCVLDTFHK